MYNQHPPRPKGLAPQARKHVDIHALSSHHKMWAKVLSHQDGVSAVRIIRFPPPYHLKSQVAVECQCCLILRRNLQQNLGGSNAFPAQAVVQRMIGLSSCAWQSKNFRSAYNRPVMSSVQWQELGEGRGHGSQWGHERSNHPKKIKPYCLYQRHIGL